MNEPFSCERQFLPGPEEGKVFEWWDVKFFEQVLSRSTDEYLARKLVTLLNNYIEILSASHLVVDELDKALASVEPTEAKRLAELFTEFRDVLHKAYSTSGVQKI